MSQSATVVSLPSDFDSSPLETVRKLNLKRNAEKLAELAIPKLDMNKKKLPVFSKRVVKKASAKKCLPQRKMKVVANSDGGETPLRTYSRAGLWSCISGCMLHFTTPVSLAAHLKSAHDLPSIPEHLAPLGLALCPFCRKVFEASRGIAAHKRHCHAPKAPVTELVGGTFPKRCFVWWEKDKKWWEGVASQSDLNNCFRVVYSAASYGKMTVSTENCHNVIFSAPVDATPVVMHLHR